MIRNLILLGMVIAVPVAGQGAATLPNFDRRTPTVLAVENVGPCVVNIKTQSYGRSYNHPWADLFQRQDDEGVRLQDRSLGSGVVVHPAGYVVTNDHVVNGAAKISVTLQGGQTVEARLVNSNSDSDLAVLKLLGPGPFPAAQLGDSDDLLVGERTIALGNPFGLQSSVTEGVLSAVNRPVHLRGKTIFKDFLQTSALINPGNSGGPLLDVNGRVIGINVAIDSRGQGICFAIPINRVKAVMTQLVDPEVTVQAWVGFEPVLKNTRLVAAKVHDGSPASKGGILEGDVVLGIDGRPVRTPFEFNVALLELLGSVPGKEVSIDVERQGRKVQRKIALQYVPLDQYQGAFKAFGMTVRDLDSALARRLGLKQEIQAPAVLTVETGSKAQDVGLQSGDLILQIDNVRIRSAGDLKYMLQRAGRAGHANLVVYRDGHRYEGTMVF